MSKIEIIYQINQLVDIVAWTWITLIMVKRVFCRGFDFSITNLRDVFSEFKIAKLARTKFKVLIHNHHYYSDALLLAAAFLAVIQFANQFYFYTIHAVESKMFARTYIWMIFHKLIEVSILLKYKKSQPKIFVEIKEEFRLLWSN